MRLLIISQCVLGSPPELSIATVPPSKKFNTEYRHSTTLKLLQIFQCVHCALRYWNSSNFISWRVFAYHFRECTAGICCPCPRTQSNGKFRRKHVGAMGWNEKRGSVAKTSSTEKKNDDCRCENATENPKRVKRTRTCLILQSTTQRNFAIWVSWSHMRRCQSAMRDTNDHRDCAACHVDSTKQQECLRWINGMSRTFLVAAGRVIR